MIPVLSIDQDEPVRVRKRVRSVQGLYIKRADVDNVEIEVYQLGTDTPTVPVFGEIITGSVPIAEVIFDTLQGWEEDDTGYNFDYTLETYSFVQEGGRSYRVEITIRYLASLDLGLSRILSTIYVRPGVRTS